MCTMAVRRMVCSLKKTMMVFFVKQNRANIWSKSVFTLINAISKLLPIFLYNDIHVNIMADNVPADINFENLRYYRNHGLRKYMVLKFLIKTCKPFISFAYILRQVIYWLNYSVSCNICAITLILPIIASLSCRCLLVCYSKEYY